MKKVIVILILAALALVAGYLLSMNTSDENLVEVQIGNVVIQAEVADNSIERVRGLLGREELPENTGMLFIFDKPGFHGIWMKDMLFPIDIVWISEDFIVVHIEEDISPETYPEVFEPGEEARYILETNAGFAAENNVLLGETISIDSL